jgi:hypothetical protein
MSLLDQVKDQMSGFEQLVAKIPGYKGYKEKELRREADKLLRDHIVNRMRTVKTQLDGLQHDLIGAGKFDLLDETGSAATQIQTFIDRVRTAAYGYSGLFDAARVKEDELDRVYEFDSALIGYADRIENAISNARAGIEGENPRALILMVRDLAREANATFNERQDVLRGTASTGV